MIHVENITINIQSHGAESGPTSALGDARMNSQQQQANAWMAVCRVLHEVCPSWMEAPGSAKENAVEAILAMAKATR